MESESAFQQDLQLGPVHFAAEKFWSEAGVTNSDAFQGQASAVRKRSWPDGAVQGGERAPELSRENSHPSLSVDLCCSVSHLSEKSPPRFMCPVLILTLSNLFKV